jgi:hypothetical protein
MKRILALLFFLLVFSFADSFCQVVPPTVFRIYQNSPEPFDTLGTFIKFQIPRDAFVYLWIEDMFNNQIASLVSQQSNAGSYQVYWNAKSHNSTYISPGTYYCKMNADSLNTDKSFFRDSIQMHFQITTSVSEYASGTHSLFFGLNQNYPNPFNPSTVISFNLPSKFFVTLKIFDLMGREVATLVSEELSMGNYTRQWNAANISSGVYFYRLQAGKYTGIKKLVLLR